MLVTIYQNISPLASNARMPEDCSLHTPHPGNSNLTLWQVSSTNGSQFYGTCMYHNVLCQNTVFLSRSNKPSQWLSTEDSMPHCKSSGTVSYLTTIQFCTKYHISSDISSFHLLMLLNLVNVLLTQQWSYFFTVFFIYLPRIIKAVSIIPISTLLNLPLITGDRQVERQTDTAIRVCTHTSSNHPILYFLSAWVRYWPDHWLSWPWFFTVSSVPQGKFFGNTSIRQCSCPGTTFPIHYYLSYCQS